MRTDRALTSLGISSSDTRRGLEKRKKMQKDKLPPLFPLAERKRRGGRFAINNGI
jgi:hypothetical protein